MTDEEQTYQKNTIRNLRIKLLRFQAELILTLPIPLSYEDWTELHRIAELEEI